MNDSILALEIIGKIPLRPVSELCFDTSADLDGDRLREVRHTQAFTIPWQDREDNLPHDL